MSELGITLVPKSEIRIPKSLWLQASRIRQVALGELLLKVVEQCNLGVSVTFRVDLLKGLIFGASGDHLRAENGDQSPDKDNTQRHNDFCLHLVTPLGTLLTG